MSSTEIVDMVAELIMEMRSRLRSAEDCADIEDDISEALTHLGYEDDE